MDSIKDNEVRKLMNKLIESLATSVKETEDYKIMTEVLQSLVERIESSTSSIEFLKQYAPNLNRRFERSRAMNVYLTDELMALGKGKNTLRYAFLYLGLFESVLANIIDLILMLFISAHPDLYGSFGKHYAKSPNDLDKINMFEKLIFLKHHKLAIIIQRINRGLRNKIAHLDFEIDADEKIMVNGQIYDLREEYHDLLSLLFYVFQALDGAGVLKLLRDLS